MTEFELDIPSLTQEGIQMNDYVFSKVRELQSISMIDWLLMIEMLILLIDSFDRKAGVIKATVHTIDGECTNELFVVIYWSQIV